jgi:hypothetical protein
MMEVEMLDGMDLVDRTPSARRATQVVWVEWVSSLVSR